MTHPTVQRALDRAEDLIFLMENGETHADNLSRRVGLRPASLRQTLARAGRSDLAERIVYRDGRAPDALALAESQDFHARPYLRAADYRESAGASRR